MRPLPRYISLLLCLVVSAVAQTIGSGAPNSQIGSDFERAFYRGNFQNEVSLPPIADVHALGSTGLVQEFYDTKKTAGVKLALILPNKAISGYANDVLQLQSDVYVYYTSIGAATAGYPTMDSAACPGIANCDYDLFSNNYVLFAISSGNPNGTTFSVSGNYLTKWTALGSFNGPLGIVLNAAASITSPAGTTGGGQAFVGGTVFTLTSGLNTGNTFAVLGAVDTLYESTGGAAGPLGFPLSDLIQSAATGVSTQVFEAGRIQVASGGVPMLLLPVLEVQLNPTGPLALAYGQTATITATTFDTNGNLAANRVVSWSTTNGRVVSITATNNVAVIQAVGSGTATVTATSEGKISMALLVSVMSPCCQVGDGAPAAVQQAFQNAVTRNRITVQVPGPNAARRTGAGYSQDLLSPDGTTHYLVAESDVSGTAYIVSGALLATYTQLGGPSGTLGFPSSDASAGGTQLFANGALGGSPPQVVSGPVLTKWAALKYEAGAAGAPTGPAIAFASQSGYAGVSQTFTGGIIYGITNGTLAGQAFLVSSPVLDRYLALGGPAGEVGVPLSDPFVNGGLTRQNFENGYIDYASGAAAQEHLTPRTPSVSANPTTALAGSRLHLTVSGFANGATIRVSVSGQPDFVVTTPNGSYSWDVLIPPGAVSGTIAIHAVDTNGTATADGSYIVRSLMDAHAQLSKASGDNQTGPPSSLLTSALVVVLKDSTGTPIPSVAVSFSASPGALVSPANAVTDAAGQASATLRLPPAGGIAAVTARAAGQIVIFDAQATGSAGISNFPQFSQASITSRIGAGTASGVQKGGFVTAVAAVLRYYQNLGVVPAANGLADPNRLNQFLTADCGTVLNGAKTCDGFLSNPDTGEQVLNLWRLVQFAGGGVDVSVEDPSLTSVGALVAGGDPVILNLALTEDGVAAGGATVVATGIRSDGSLQISDPNPGFAQTSLNAYLAGFVAGGHSWQGTVLSAVRLLPRTPSGTGVLLSVVSQPVTGFPVLSVSSATGSCGAPLIVQDAAVFGAPAASLVRQSEFVYCDGSRPLYQVGITASAGYRATLTDLSAGGTTTDLSGSASAGYQISRSGGVLAVSAPAVGFASAAVVNGASFQSGVSPGELISIFGSGLSGPGTPTAVAIGGLLAQVLFATPFQVNAVVPAGVAAGDSPITISSSFGSVSQTVTVQAAAPGIFVLSTNADGTVNGAAVNQDGTLNGPANPLARGKVLIIYCTGLGVVTPAGPLSVTTLPVQVVLGGSVLPVAFSGLTPGFTGLYQVNVTIPAATPPGLYLSLDVRVAGMDSNSIPVAIQ